MRWPALCLPPAPRSSRISRVAKNSSRNLLCHVVKCYYTPSRSPPAFRASSCSRLGQSLSPRQVRSICVHLCSSVVPSLPCRDPNSRAASHYPSPPKRQRTPPLSRGTASPRQSPIFRHELKEPTLSPPPTAHRNLFVRNHLQRFSPPRCSPNSARGGEEPPGEKRPPNDRSNASLPQLTALPLAHFRHHALRTWVVVND
jgi:hypothetical protein